jgi:YidC/Oxa1 family membrane protein insertase
MSVLDPLSHALATVVVTAHDGLTTLGADPGGGATWVLAVAAVVVAVRLALLPLVAQGVRQAHAAARARPQLRALAQWYRGRTDSTSLRRLREERTAIAAEHRLSALGCLPLLVQLPVVLALYHLLAQVAAGTPLGPMTPELVASLGAATLLGVPLADRGYFGLGPAHLTVVAALALVAAGLSYVTQRYVVAPNTLTDGVPQALASAQQLLPAVSAVSLLVAGGVVPVALVTYWICNSTWTLAQSAVITRWFPTPGTAAAARRAPA